MIDFKTISAHSIIKEIPTTGHSPLLVLADDFKSYIIKNDKGRIPPLSLLNECFALYALEQWNIPTAPATFIQLPTTLLDQGKFSLNHKPFYYDFPAFASQLIENATDVNDTTLPLTKSTFNQISNPMQLLHIALFDTWVENDDRKPSNYNLLYKPQGKKNKIIPIDHAFIFSTLPYSELDPNSYYPIANEHLLVSDLGRIIKKYIRIDTEFIKKEEQYFYLCVNNCKAHYDNFSKQLALLYSIDPETMLQLKRFIFDDERNKKVFEEYICRLKQK